MLRLTISAGIDKDRDGQQVENLEQKLQTIRNELALRFGGFTETHGVGGWVDHNRVFWQERSISWKILVPKLTDGAAEAAAEMVGEALNQYSVVLEVEKVQAIFLDIAPAPALPESEAPVISKYQDESGYANA